MTIKFKNIIKLYTEGANTYAVQKTSASEDACRGCALNRRSDCGVSCKELGGRLRKVDIGDFVSGVDGNYYVVYQGDNKVITLYFWCSGRSTYGH